MTTDVLCNLTKREDFGKDLDWSAGGAGTFLILIAFASSSAGNWSLGLERAVYSLCAVLFLVQRQIPLAGLLWGIVVLLAGGRLVPAGLHDWAGLWHVILTLSGVGILGLWKSPRAAAARRPALAGVYPFVFLAAAVLAVQVVILANPQTRLFVDPFFRSLSVSLTGLWGSTPLPLGTTYWSLPLLLTFLMIPFLQPTWQRRIYMLVMGAAALVIYFALLSPLQTQVLAGKPPRSLLDWYARNPVPHQTASEPMSWKYLTQMIGIERPQIILLALLVLVSLSAQKLLPTPTLPLATASKSDDPGRTLRGQRVLAVLGFAAVLGVSLAWLTIPACVSQRDLAGRKVAMMTSNLLMRVPQRGSYGPKSTGMFGRLPGTLRALGLSVDEIAGPNDLRADHEILIFANLQANFTPPQKERIWNWVRRGGGLLVLTDHTGDTGLRLPTNDLLEPFGLQAGFDTAKLLSVDGSYHYEPLLGSPIHAIRGVRWRGALDYGTGASIRAIRPAVPVMQARYAYIDPGNFTAVQKGYLQNLLYDKGEQLGDVAVVGFSRLGRGRAMLFGDTSSFQNGALCTSLEFVRQVLGMLLPQGPAPDRPSLVTWLVIGSLAAGAIVVIYLFVSAAGASLCVAVLLLAWCLGWSAMRKLPEPVSLKTDRVAVIDISTHPYVNVQGWTDWAFSGLEMNLLREGYVPLVNEGPLEAQLALQQAGDVLFLISPLRRFTRRERQSIDRFLTRGGTVILNCGYEEADNVAVVLSAYGMQILNVPLGASPDVEPIDPARVHFFNGWQVQGEGQILEQIGDRPVVISRRVGQGNLIVIGDSKFFWDKNLESRETHRPGNVSFLAGLLRRGG
jgi:hypothetical protein